MAIVKIGNTVSDLVALPSPQKLTIKIQDIDSASTTRNAKGEMLRDRVSGGDGAKRKLEFEWSMVEQDVAEQILNAVKNVFVWVEYFDPLTCASRTAQFYSGDRSMDIYSTNYMNRGVVMFKELKFNLIEK